MESLKLGVSVIRLFRAGGDETTLKALVFGDSELKVSIADATLKSGAMKSVRAAKRTRNLKKSELMRKA